MNPSEDTFRSWDGTELFYRAWLPAKPAHKALLLFHRGHEHSGRWQGLVEGMALEDVAVFAWDARGHGRSPGERGAAENLAAVIRDHEAFARHVAHDHGITAENTMLLAHSVGAVTAAAWVHDYAPKLRGMILATPAFRVKLYVPFAVPALRVKEGMTRGGFVKSYVRAGMLTHDAAEAARYESDPLVFKQIAVNILLDLHDTSSRLLADAGAIHVPTLILAADNDWIVKLPAQRAFFDRLSSPIKRMEVLRGFHHAIFHENERTTVFAKCRNFIVERFAEPPATPSLQEADQYGYTRAEFDRLRGPGSPIFSATRGFLKRVGPLSEGVRLGWRSGFDSGATLDYVYRNEPQGATPLGRIIDRNYLGSVGWRGIRQRRIHLEALLESVMTQTHQSGRPVRILDIACGGGRYVIETMRRLSHIPATALLRDYKPENLAAAAALAHALDVPGVSTALGDAFDRASLAKLRPRPNIAIVSGLYELFPENAPLRESLGGLASVLELGGHLIYTNQPWHPQVEFIARVLTNREGEPWIMRRRTQAEMDELVEAAGFEKIHQEIDEWGIFSVSIARRLES